MSLTNRKFILKHRPVGQPQPSDFEVVSETISDIPKGSLLVRNHFISLDPAQRGWMDDLPSYMPPIPLGDAVRATTVGKVIESKNPNFEKGQWVLGLNGIEEYSIADEGGFTAPIDASIVPSPSNFLSILGAVGLTAYYGLLDSGKPEAGETVLVTGAAGAVGSAVGQIAKIKGCRAVGIAGGPIKCKRLLEEYGFDATIDYKGKDVEALSAAIKKAAPDGVDIIFENVGGDILDAGLLNLNEYARVVLCGLISEYNNPEAIGARNLWRLITQQAKINGFLIRDYAPQFAEGGAVMAGWIAEGKINFREHMETGIENAYETFMLLFNGGNQGKLILDVSPKA